MLVHERMTRHPTIVPPSMPVADALKIVREQGIRRLPVVDGKTGRLIGIVTEKQLLYASPSPVTSLSVHELHYLLSKLTVQEVMSTDLYTVGEDTPVEEAALTMVDRNVGALPVMRDGDLVGIITETDLFKTFVELFAARQEGVRLTLLVPHHKGELLEIAQAIAEVGGNIIALGTFEGDDLGNRILTVKVVDAPREALESALQAAGAKIVDVRHCMQAQAC